MTLSEDVRVWDFIGFMEIFRDFKGFFGIFRDLLVNGILRSNLSIGSRFRFSWLYVSLYVPGYHSYVPPLQ